MALILFQDAQADPAQIEQIYKDINEAPPWRGMDVQKHGHDLLSAIEETKYLSTDELKEIVGKLISSNSRSIDTWSKLYVLNRFYFKVPASYRANEIPKHFGSWWISDSKGPLYPLNEEANGTFIITEGYMEGYMGQSYDALGEMDYFSLKYGVRYAAK